MHVISIYLKAYFFKKNKNKKHTNGMCIYSFICIFSSSSNYKYIIYILENIYNQTKNDEEEKEKKKKEKKTRER